MAFSLIILLPDDQLYIDLNITKEQLYFLGNIVGNKHLCPLTFLRSWKCSNGELKSLGFKEMVTTGRRQMSTLTVL